MSGNTTNSDALLYSELKDRTKLNNDDLLPIVDRAKKMNKNKKYLKLLTGEAISDYEKISHARRAAEEEFMFVTNGDLDQTVEILKGSALVDNVSTRVLRAETQNTFTDLGRSTYNNKGSWSSTDNLSNEDLEVDNDDDSGNSSGSEEQIIRNRQSPMNKDIGDPSKNKYLKGDM